MARTDRELTDEQWERLAPLLPPQRPKMGRPPNDHRTVVEGMVWILRTGAPWRDLPERFGKWQTVAGRFYDWRRNGVFARALLGAQTEGDALGELDWLLHHLDGSVVRAHQHAAGARKRPSKADEKRDHPSTRRSPRTQQGRVFDQAAPAG
jgi:transposase